MESHYQGTGNLNQRAGNNPLGQQKPAPAPTKTDKKKTKAMNALFGGISGGNQDSDSSSDEEKKKDDPVASNQDAQGDQPPAGGGGNDVMDLLALDDPGSRQPSTSNFSTTSDA